MWVNPGSIQVGDEFTVSAGSISGFGGWFGFKAVGTALNGITSDAIGVFPVVTVVDMATTLTDFASVDLLAVRRASSVEFYVNGVLKGSSTVSLPAGSDSGAVYDLTVTNGGAGNDAQVAVNMLTVGIPMF